MMAFGAKIKLTVDTSGASAFRKQIQDHVNKTTKNDPIKLKHFSVQVTNPSKLIGDIQKQFNSAGKGIEVKVNSINATNAIKNLRSQIETMLKGLTVGGMQAFLGAESVVGSADAMIAKQKELAKVAADVEQKAISSKAALQELGNVQSVLGSTFTNISKVNSSEEVNVLLAEYESLNQKIQELKTNESARTSENVNGIAKEVIALRQKTAAVLEQESAAKKASASQQSGAKQEAVLQQRSISLHSKINRYIIANSKAYKEHKAEFDAMLSVFSGGSKLTEDQIRSINLRFLSLANTCKSTGLETKTFFDTLKSGWEKFGGWSLVTRSMTAAYRVVKEMVTAVKELDAAMTELKKVTDLSEGSYENYVQTASQTAQKIGASLSDTVNATADFSRLGYELNDAASLAEAALVYKNIGDGIEDVSVASESLISTIKAFGYEANDAMSIVDKFNEVGNNFAISSEGIGTALQKSASSLAAANNTLEESIALATGMNAVIQNPEVVGTTLKTVSMYLRAAKTEAEAAGESTDGMANSVSELRDQILTLTGNKVDIMIDDENFKSTYQIMKELSEVWGNITDIDQANILELIGGKRNATAVTSLLTNFGDAESALATALDATGSATTENEKHLDSIAGKLSVLQAKFETFSNNVINSGLVKFIIDAGNVLLTILNTLDEIHLLIPMVVSGIALISKSNNIKTGVNVALQGVNLKDINSVTAALIGQEKAYQKLIISEATHRGLSEEEIKNNMKKMASTSALTQAQVQNAIAAAAEISAENQEQRERIESAIAAHLQEEAIEDLTEEKLKEIIVSAGVSAENAKETASRAATILGIKQQEVANVGLLKSMGKVISSYGVYIGVALAVIAVIAGLCKAYDEYHVSSEEAATAVEEATSALSSTESELEAAQNRLSEVRQSISELSSLDKLSLTEESDLENLRLENVELQAQIQLLKEKKAVQEEEKTKAESDAWGAANGSIYGWGINVYTDSGEKGTWFDKIAHANWVGQGGESYLMNEVDAAEAYMARLAEIEKEKEALAEQGIEENAQEWINLDEEAKKYRSSLVEISDSLENTGENGKALSYEISLSLMQPTERLLAFKEILDTLFKDKKYSAQDIVDLYGKDGYETLTAYIDGLKSMGQIDFGEDGILDASDLDPVIDKFGEIEESAVNAVEETTKLSETMNKLESSGNAIKTLSSAYQELSEDGGVSFSTLSDINEEFSNVKDIENYINALAAAQGNTAETAQILSDLTKEAVTAKIGADNLADANLNVVAAMLEEAGVANSLVITEEMIAKAKVEAAIQSINLADASSITKDWLDKLTVSTGLTEEEIYDLIIAEILFNEQKLTTSQQIEALTNLAVAAGIAREELGKVYSTDFVGPLPEGSESMSPEEYANRIREKIGAATSGGNGTTVQFTPQTSGSSTDKELEAWNKLVAEQKHLLETDQITKEQYYEWLESAYKENISATEEHADEIRSIEEELYNWEKEKIKENIALKEAQLENQLLYGEISEEEYQKQLTDAYFGARQEIESNTELYGVDEQERLSEINSYLDKEKSAYNAAYDAEHQQLEHKLAMNLISEEQYLIELQALYDKYYKDNEMYSEEAIEVEEEIYDLRVELVEKWSQAAVDAIEAMAEATESMIDAIKDLIQDSIDTHEENFNLEKQLLDHALAMNYISEEQYYSDLDKLYKKYFKDKNLYMEQYWENQEEIYQHEQDMLEDSASAIEDIHAKVVDMIKQELEDAIDAIEETKDKYLDLIEIRREAMNDMKDEEDYEKERAEKLSSISELQRQLNALAYDTSAEGVAKYKQVYAELQKAKDELAEFENDHAYEKMNDQLDKEAESIEVGADAEISGLEELLDNNEYLVQEAWDRMDGMSKELFDQLNEYTKKHSTSIKDDITDVWNTATSAVGDYTNAYNAYLGITGQIGKSGMTDEEYAQDSARTTGKQISGWVSTALNFGASMLEIGVGLMSSFMGIAGSLMGGSAGSFLSMGSGLLGTFGGLGTSILGAITSVLGGFATGTNYVPKTGVYRTDELGEELKLFKNPTSGNYTLLTEGSKVFTNEQVGRLINIINSPNSLLDTASIMDVNQVNIPSIPSTQNTNQEVSVQNVFQIHSSDPEGVVEEIKRMLPEIAEHTVGNIINGMSNSGVKRITQKLV